MRNQITVLTLVVINVILIGITLLFLSNKAAHTQSLLMGTPPLISYQGMLSDEEGIPINGIKDITVTIYNSETSGTALWSESHNNLLITDGIFTILLGSISPLPNGLFDEPSRWLEIDVEGVTLAPRQQFTTVPYALTSEKAVFANIANYALDANLLNGQSADDLAKETWELGDIWVNGLTGEVEGAPYFYRSDEAWSSFINNFQPPSSQKSIKSVYFFIVQKTGSYTAGTFGLVFEVRDVNGNLQHTVSSEIIDLSDAPTGAWVEVTLSTNPDDLVIAPGEYLGIRVYRDGPEGGDLQIYAAFKAEVH